MSYRSTAFLGYYALSDGGLPTVKYKWMPPYEGFTDLDLGRGYKEYPWLHYFNTSDNTMTYMSQFGLLAAKTVDGVNVSEALVTKGEEGTSLARFRFTEIFEAHHTLLGTRYPQPRKQYYVGDLTPRPVTAWLTYKPVPEDAGVMGGGAIQWAWREVWQNLVRGKPDMRSIMRDIPLNTCDAVDYGMDWLSFLDISYPNYTYDYRISEFRRVVAESAHTINWEPSKYDPDNPLPTHFIIGVDDGPKRLLSPKLELMSTISGTASDLQFESIELGELKEHLDFYTVCSGVSWLNGVSSDTDLEEQVSLLGLITGGTSSFMLYSENTEVVSTEEEAKLKADDDDRKVVTTRDGEEVTHYFNRGLVLDVNVDMLKYLPRLNKPIEQLYEFSLSEPAHDDSQFSTIIPLEYYPANENFGMTYSNLEDSEVNLIFKFSTPVLIGRIEVVYNKGAVIEDEEAELKTFYNIPKTIISKSVDGVAFSELKDSVYEFGQEDAEPNLTTKTYDIDGPDLEKVDELYAAVSIHFTYGVTAEDLEEQGREYHPSYTHLMDIRAIRIYTVEYSPLTEVIDTYERKFNISTGGFGDIPVHGNDTTGSLLYPNPWELSTVYQQDNAFGMIGAPGWSNTFNSISKIRGRKAQQIRTDPEVLEGTYSDFEGAQKKLYDEVALDGTESVTMASVAKEVLAAIMVDTKVKVYPQWSCTLKNKNMVPLREVPTKSKYYPDGHRWTWGLENIRDFYNCGGGGLRSWKTLFDYKWGRVSGVYGYGYDTDAVFDLYVYAMEEAFEEWINQSSLQDYL